MVTLRKNSFQPEVKSLLTRDRPERINFHPTNIYKVGLILLALTNLTTEPIICDKTWKTMCQYDKQLISIAKSCLNPEPKARPNI